MSKDTAVAPCRVLLVGNSQFGVWDIPSILRDISQSGRPLDCEGRVIDGAWLRTHLNDKQSLETITNGDWNVVVLQEHFQAPTQEGREKFFKAAEEFHAIIAKTHAKEVLYASPNIETDFPDGFNAIHSLTHEMASKLNVVTAPAGLACLKALKKAPDLDLHDTDRKHPNHKASYIGACALYAAITGESPIGLKTLSGDNPISENEATLFQTSAWEAYLETNK